MVTYTASLFANTPKAVHAGTNAIVVNYSSGAVTSSSGDIIYLAKIPHGARVVEVIEDHSTNATGHALDIGFATGGTAGGGASFSALITAGAQATKNRLNVLGIPGWFRSLTAIRTVMAFFPPSARSRARPRPASC